MLKASGELNSFLLYTYCIRQETTPTDQFGTKFKVLCLNRGKIKPAVKQVKLFSFYFLLIIA